VLACLVYFFLFRELNQNKDQFQLENLFSSGFRNSKFILFAFLLMPANWLIESLKWQFLVRKIETIRLIDAAKAVFAGTAVSIFTPNRIGDFMGRVFILKRADRIDGIVATILGNMSQLLMTILLGGISIIYFSKQLLYQFFGSINYLYLTNSAITIILVLLILLFFNFPRIEKILFKQIDRKKYPFVRHLNLISKYSSSELTTILSFSFIRYIIYSLQFYFLLLTFDLELNLIEGILTAFIIFLSLTLVPSIAITELGLRALIAISLFDFIGKSAESELAITSATSMLWFINIALAALIGGIFIFQLKFFRKTNH
jgi:hypothetical protein